MLSVAPCSSEPGLTMRQKCRRGPFPCFVASAWKSPGLWRYAPLAHIAPNLTRETLRRTIPGVAGWIDKTHRRYRQDFLADNLEGGEANFKPVDKLTR